MNKRNTPDDNAQSFIPENLFSQFPDRSESLIKDLYLMDLPEMSTRLFRLYRPIPAHYHRFSNETLYVLKGHGRFWLNDAKNEIAFKAGTLITFPKNIVHAIPDIGTEPLIFLAVDAPRRAPDDVIFVDSPDLTEKDFISEIKN